MINLHEPFIQGNEKMNVSDAIDKNAISSNSYYTSCCTNFLGKYIDQSSILLTPSCTSALEIAFMLLDLEKEDEVILPSFTFVSSANPILINGGTPVFVDIDPLTMNICPVAIENAITEKTRAILVMHYSGITCNMEAIGKIAKKHGLIIIEDAAHALGSRSGDKHLGAIGDIGAYSFHYTKNIHCGEGGALVINNEKFAKRAEIIREKGTNRTAFFRGEVDKYSWVDIGTSGVLSELNAAFLFAQLQSLEVVNNKRKSLASYYEKYLDTNFIPERIPINDYGNINCHSYWIKCRNNKDRTQLINFLNKKAIKSAFHYIPLHSSAIGIKHGKFSGQDIYTTVESNRILRIPMHTNLEEKQIKFICEMILEYYKSHAKP